MDGRTLEDALLHPFLLSLPEVTDLQDNRQILYKEHTAQNRDEQFLMDNDSEYGNDSPDSQASGIAHEDLRRECIVPKETYQRTDKGANEDYQFFTSGDVHNVQITGILDVAGHVCQYAQRDPDNGGISCRHPVHTVVQIGSVGYGGHHKNGDDDKHNPTRALRMFAHETYEVGIIEVIVLEKRDGGLGGFLVLALMHHIYDMPVFLNLYVLADNHLRAQVKRQADYQPQPDLSDNLELAVKPFLVLAEHLDIIVQKSQRAQPDRGNQHQYHVDVVQLAQQKARNQYRYNDDDAPHGRDSRLAYVKRVDGSVPLGLGDLPPLQQIDEIFSEDSRYEQRQNHRHQRPERYIAEHARSGEVELF